MAKVKISEIVLEGFRGAVDPVRLLPKDGQNIVLFGNNGDGKSSFTDAIEWFFCDDIEHLRPEGCSRDDYFNRSLDPTTDARVSLAFTTPSLDSTKTLRRRGGFEQTNATPDFLGFIETVSQERIILRHHTMRAFVDKSKKDKLEEVEEIIGFSTVTHVRTELVRAKNTLESNNDLTEFRGKLSERERDLRSLLGEQPITEESVVALAEQFRLVLNWSKSITDISTLSDVANTADQQLQVSGRDNRLARLTEIEKLIPSFPSIFQAVDKAHAMVIRHNQLVAKRKTIETAALNKLYEAASDILARQLTEPDKCPLCGNAIDTSILTVRLRTDLDAIGKTLSVRDALLKDVDPLMRTMLALGELLNLLSRVEATDVFSDMSYSSLLEAWGVQIESWAEALDLVRTKLEPVNPVMPSEKKWKELEETLNSLNSQLSSERNSALGGDVEKRLYDNMSNLRNLSDWYFRYREIVTAISVFDRQITSLQLITDAFETAENNALTEILNTLSKDVNEYFTKYLHPDDKVEKIKFVPTGTRGIEFQVHFYGNEVCPPRRVLSESHLNSLGICLFLASARHFNQIGGFVLLDDVVSSFDANHRRTLARLLRDKFSDLQVILLTHDDMWFSQLKDDLPRGQWLFQEIGKWNYKKGIQLISFSPMSLKQEVEWLLNNNRTESAANKSRTLIEASLKELCEQLGVTGLEFRVGQSNDLREPAELIDALINYLKTNQSLRSPAQKQLFNDIRSDQLLTNIGSHHRTLGTTGLKRGDIESVLRDLDEFFALFICQKCRKQASRKFSGRNAKLKQCECGILQI